MCKKLFQMIIGLRKKEVPSNAKKVIKFGSIIEGTESTIMQSLYVLNCVFFLLQMKVECISVLARRLQTPLASGSRKLLILFADEAYLTIASLVMSFGGTAVFLFSCNLFNFTCVMIHEMLYSYVEEGKVSVLWLSRFVKRFLNASHRSAIQTSISSHQVISTS